MLLSAAPACEKLGGRWLHAVAGVVLIEATKEIYAPASARAKVKRRAATAPLPDRTAPARMPASKPA